MGFMPADAKAQPNYFLVIKKPAARADRHNPPSTPYLTYTPGVSIGTCSLTAAGVEYLWFPESPFTGWSAE
jgi:hypothetical protein